MIFPAARSRFRWPIGNPEPYIGGESDLLWVASGTGREILKCRPPTTPRASRWGRSARSERLPGWPWSCRRLAFDVRPSDLPGGVAGPVPVVYREVNGRQAKLDLYLPSAPPPSGGRPIALAIHGGGWRGGSKDEFGLMVARLARHGYLVASADYRLSKPGSPSWPENFEDVREAVRWLRRNARRYDADPSRIVAIGASAGGHLAALLGMHPDGPVSGRSQLEGDFAPSDGSARVQAVVNFYGPTDLAELARIKPATVGPMALFLGGPAATFPGRYRDASPAAHASPDDPPMLLIYGSADPLIPTSQADRLTESLDSVGVPRRLIVIEGAVHGFGFRAGTRDLLPEILAFLDEVWARRPIAPR